MNIVKTRVVAYKYKKQKKMKKNIWKVINIGLV